MKARNRLAMAGVVVAAALATLVGVPGTASADHCPPGTTYPADCVHGITVTTSPTVPTDVEGNQVRRADPASRVSGETAARGATADDEGLPLTGGDVVGLAVIGLGAVGLGALLVRRGRRTA